MFFCLVDLYFIERGLRRSENRFCQESSNDANCLSAIEVSYHLMYHICIITLIFDTKMKQTQQFTSFWCVQG